jgi:hypothetical protein
MYRRTTAILILLALTLAALPAQAVFENLMVSPRARAMGDAGVAVPDAPFAAYLNPALLAYGDRSGSVGLSYLQPYGLSFNKLGYLGGQFRLPGRAGSIGIGLRQYGVEYEGVDLAKEATLTLSHGIFLYNDLHSSVALGYGLNVYRLEFGETVTGVDPGDDTSLGADLSLVATLHDRTRIGVMIHNLNSPKIGRDEEELPRRLQGAVAYTPYTGVVTTFELESVHGERVQWHGGLELEVVPNFDLRFGIMTEPSKLTAGFGYQLSGFALNYAYSTGGGVLDSSHQFGLTVAWGGEAK